ncbi:MAG: hypothetical protein C5B58_08705 [Acidobacteria bacterium]|nr:MAG: hypothetical protein C5B58_08705 [Acidobacteriota bacterium]
MVPGSGRVTGKPEITFSAPGNFRFGDNSGTIGDNQGLDSVMARVCCAVELAGMTAHRPIFAQ